ncbi:MAG TPA: hypothetical protein DDZ51_11880 [Planctomycetaceae bacterium]|nr:hypothetical protein [Planctomycetaceae bacterium]
MRPKTLLVDALSCSLTWRGAIKAGSLFAFGLTLPNLLAPFSTRLGPRSPMHRGNFGATLVALRRDHSAFRLAN